jgi:hypothetical protein
VQAAISEAVLITVNKQVEIAKKRLIEKKFNNYYIQSGKVFLNVAAGIPSATFNSDHVIEGVGKKGVQGLIGNDFSFASGSTVDVKYDTGEPDASPAVAKNAWVYSVNPSPANPRKKLGVNEWNTLLNENKPKTVSRKITYEDMPQWNNALNPNRVSFFGIIYNSAPPTSANSNDGQTRDDANWYWVLKSYADHCKTDRKAKRQALIEAQNNVDTLKGDKGNDTSKTTPDGGKTTTTPTTVTPPSGTLSGIGDDTKPVIYNFPAVKEMYFRSDNLENFKVNSGNLSKKVSEAKKLWEDSASYKGMIQSFIVPARLNTNGQWWSPSGGDGLQGQNKRINTRRYGFQFQYNPSTVTMAYAGAPQVDIGLQTSGTDKVPLIGSSVTSSTVSFSLLINRMNDFKYLDSLIFYTSDSKVNEALLVSNRTSAMGNVRINDLSTLFGEVYSHTGNHPVRRANAGTAAEVTSINDELRQIRKLGTMYDIEYLLRTLLGYQLKSSLRNVFTSDIGYLGAYPVELHLGNNLRYLGVIDGFNVSHTIFNQNMVPVFSNVTITFSRLPDFAKPFNEVASNAKVTKTDPVTDGDT